jgi:hypothetical protein
MNKVLWEKFEGEATEKWYEHKSCSQRELRWSPYSV